MSGVIIQTLSLDRFGTYLTAAGHNADRALKLYIWNAQVGEAFHTPIQAVEIAIRNRVNQALVAKFGATWWQNATFRALLDDQRRGDIEMVLRRGHRRGITIITGQMVAGLSFGFWVGMLQPRFNPDVWSSQLRISFPSLPATETRHSLHKYAGDVAYLRNRISHHEPIFKRDLLLDFSELMKLLEWVCPDTQVWIKPYCRVPALIRQKP